MGGDVPCDASAPVDRHRQRALAMPVSRWTLLLLASLSLSVGAAASGSASPRHDMEVITQSDDMSVSPAPTPNILTQISMYWSASTFNDGRSPGVFSRSKHSGPWSLTRLGHTGGAGEHELQGAAKNLQRSLAAANAIEHGGVQPGVEQGCMRRQQQQQLRHDTTRVDSGESLSGNRGSWQQLYTGQSGGAGSSASGGGGGGGSLSSSSSRRRLSAGPGDDFTENGYDYCISKLAMAARLVQ